MAILGLILVILVCHSTFGHVKGNYVETKQNVRYCEETALSSLEKFTIGKDKARSLLECVVKCRTHGNCSSVVYINRMCELYENITEFPDNACNNKKADGFAAYMAIAQTQNGDPIYQQHTSAAPSYQILVGETSSERSSTVIVSSPSDSNTKSSIGFWSATGTTISTAMSVLQVNGTKSTAYVARWTDPVPTLSLPTPLSDDTDSLPTVLQSDFTKPSSKSTKVPEIQSRNVNCSTAAVFAVHPECKDVACHCKSSPSGCKPASCSTYSNGFIKYRDHKLAGYAVKKGTSVAHDARSIAWKKKKIICRSYDYRSSSRSCHYTRKDKCSIPKDFKQAKGRDYYHRKCLSYGET